MGEETCLWHKLFIEPSRGKPRDFKDVGAEEDKSAKPSDGVGMQKQVEVFDKSNYVMIAMIDSDGEVKRSDGLVTGHAYSLIACVTDPSARTSFVQLRNPWGNEIEWNGKWSDGDKSSWIQFPELAKKLQGTEFHESLTSEVEHHGTADGKFWMEWSDFDDRFN